MSEKLKSPGGDSGTRYWQCRCAELTAELQAEDNIGHGDVVRWDAVNLVTGAAHDDVQMSTYVHTQNSRFASELAYQHTMSTDRPGSGGDRGLWGLIQHSVIPSWINS